MIAAVLLAARLATARAEETKPQRSRSPQSKDV
jgi:hypothetical protein